MVMTSLGRWYMANHGVTSLSMVEDMRTVLIAYWGVAAKRITENICMLFETHLLAKLGEDAAKLLHHAQKDDGGVADELLAQDAEIERRREETRKKKTPCEGTASKKEVVTAPTLETVSLTRSDEQVPKAEVVVLSGTKPPLEAFTFSSNGDNGGFIYWLGTSGRRDRFTNPMEKGRVRVTSSGMAQGSEALLTYPVDSKNKAWRYLRLHLAGANSKGTMEMPVCAWEFCGQLFAA
ncbi:hypothetical protein JL722_14631 [Aureococcus anophagefferens]|nr:hypothetical protein JL722_14631 [Aureococcus anophagefferens]